MAYGYGTRPHVAAMPYGGTRTPQDEQTMPLSDLGASGKGGGTMIQPGGGMASGMGSTGNQYSYGGGGYGGGGMQVDPRESGGYGGWQGGGGQGSQDWTQGLGVSGGYQTFNPWADPAAHVGNPSAGQGWGGPSQFGQGVYQTDPGHYGGGDLQHNGYGGGDLYHAQFGFGDIQNDPGYQYQQQQAREATNANLAARGLSESGGALKELQDRAQGIASQNANDYFSRYMGQLGFNAGEAGRGFGQGLQAQQFNANEAGRGFQQGQQALGGAYGRYAQDRGYGANQGQQGFSNAMDILNAGYGRFANDRSYYQNERQRLFGNATGEDQRQYDNAFRGGQQQWQNDYTQNQGNFDNYFRLAQLGLGATGQNTGYQYGLGQGMGDLYGDQGNAASAGTVGSANAWGNGLAGAGNAAYDYWAQQRR